MLFLLAMPLPSAQGYSLSRGSSRPGHGCGSVSELRVLLGAVSFVLGIGLEVSRQGYSFPFAVLKPPQPNGLH